MHDADTNESMRERLEQAPPWEICGRNAFCNAVPNDALPQRNARASALVYPSWMETQGIVVVEGTASGKAGIASQTRPRSEQIDDAVNGLPCDPMDSASIGKGLIVCLRRSELRRALGQVARQTAGDRFSLPILTENDERFYQLCMS